MSPFNGLFKNSCLTNPNFPLGLPLPKLDKKNKLSEYSVLLSEIVTFLTKKRIFNRISQKCFKRIENHSLAVCGSKCREKQFFEHLSRFTALNKKGCFHKVQIFLWKFPFSNLLRKTNFLSISELLSEIVIFWLKRDVFIEFHLICFKTTEKHSSAVCGTRWGEKQFLLIFSPFYRFDQKKLFKQIQIFLRIFPFSNLIMKTNFLSISLLLSERINFWQKREVFSELPQKCFKQQRSIV